MCNELRIDLRKTTFLLGFRIALNLLTHLCVHTSNRQILVTAAPHEQGARRPSLHSMRAVHMLKQHFHSPLLCLVKGLFETVQ